MSEIEKAREALEEAERKWLSGYRTAIDALNRATDAAIEAAKGYKPQPGDRAFDLPSVTPAPKVGSSISTGDPELDKRILEYNIWFNLCLTPEQKAEHLRKQRESWVRGEMGLGLDNKRATEKGGEADSPGRHERPATGLDKSPPAVEAPAAGDKGSSGALLAASHRDGYEAGKADTSALARRLAERMEWGLAVLKNVVAVDDVVGQSVIRLTEDVLTEARKAGLIE